MITAEMIPDEALWAAERAYGDCNCHSCRKAVRRVAVALINAWPGVCKYEPDILDPVVNPARIILPLKEQTNDD